MADEPRWIPGQNRKRALGSGGGAPSGPAGGDLSGTYPNPTVTDVNGVPFSPSPPTSGHVLVANGTQFASVAMSGDATITSAGVITVTTGGPPSGAAGGDLDGTYPNPTLDAIIAAGGPTGSATVVPVITYDTKGRLTAVTTATIVGPFAPSGTAGGDLSGSYPNPTVAQINGELLGDTTPTNGYVLTADGTEWAAAPPPSASGAVASNRALAISGSYYTDTFVTAHRNSQWGGNDATFLTGGKAGIVYVGGPAEWDELRQRVVGAGDGFGAYVWGIYELDDDTLLPTALVFDSGNVLYTGATGDFVVTPGSPVATTTNFIAIGVCCVGTNPGAGRPTFLAGYVGDAIGFYYYGVAAIPTTNATNATWRALRMTSATEVRTAMAPAAAWAVSGNMTGGTDEDVDGGLWIRRSA